MNGYLKLSVEQVITAIQMLSPEEKRKMQRRLPDLFDAPDYANLPRVQSEPASAKPEAQKTYPYHFLESRKLLGGIEESLSAVVIADREERF
jgi:hypothetical protein